MEIPANESTTSLGLSSSSLPLDPYNKNSSSYIAKQQFVYYGEAVIQPCILVFGTITNTISLIVLRKVKMNFIFRTCLIALAMSDLSTCVTGFISMILEVVYFNGEMPFGLWHNKAVLTYAFYYTYLMFICCSASLVILIALIRNMFIMSPMKARNYFTPRNTKIACLIMFLITLCFFAPSSLTIIYQSCFLETEHEFCIKINETIPNLQKISSKYMFAVSTIYGPVIILAYTICFICIRVTVGRSVDVLSSMTMKSKDNNHQDSTRKRTKTASRVTRTLLVILVLDVICTLPMVIQGIGLLLAPTSTVFDKSDIDYDVFDVITEIFLNMRPTYNFWLYMFHHPEFRHRLKQIFTGKKHKWRRPSGYERSLSSSDYRTEHTFITRDTNLSSSRRRTSDYKRPY